MMSGPPVTITSLFIWKIKHWASRLYSCKFPPPEDEADDRCDALKPMSEGRRIRVGIEEDQIMHSSGGEIHLREEDYIVFCFTEDGEIRLMEDTKPDASTNTITHLCPHTNKGEEKWRKDSSGDDEGNRMNGIAQCDESSDSNQSQASTASFDFPILRWDWVGSPIKMPNPDCRKHKFRAWILRLCTFPNP